MLKQSLDFLVYLKNEFDVSICGIKPQNIFIFKDTTIKFSDFGIARKIITEEEA